MFITFDGGETYSLAQKLVADDGAVDARFGNLFLLAGNLMVVSAFRDNDNGADSGNIYLLNLFIKFF